MHQVNEFGDIVRNGLTVMGLGVTGFVGTPYEIRGYGRSYVPFCSPYGKGVFNILD